jgi:sodium/bile acid cotransporter 7
MVLLAIVMVTTTVTARKLGFPRADEITIVFCGSKKSLASGVPWPPCCCPRPPWG